jgi:hypothetical protein
MSTKTTLETDISDISTRLIGIAMKLPEPWQAEVLSEAGKLVQLEVAMEWRREQGYLEAIMIPSPQHQDL